MRNEISYSPQARRDLEEIWDHLATELQNPAAARRTVSRVLDAVDRLEEFPNMGVSLSSIAHVESDYQVLVTGSYLTFYRVCGKEVYIDRVLYGRRDYLRVLFGEDICPEEKG